MDALALRGKTKCDFILFSCSCFKLKLSSNSLAVYLTVPLEKIMNKLNGLKTVAVGTIAFLSISAIATSKVLAALLESW